jgi:hypothetical protein
MTRRRASIALIAVAAGALLALPAAARASLHDCDIQATNTMTISSVRAI